MFFHKIVNRDVNSFQRTFKFVSIFSFHNSTLEAFHNSIIVIKSTNRKDQGFQLNFKFYYLRECTKAFPSFWSHLMDQMQRHLQELKSRKNVRQIRMTS